MTVDAHTKVNICCLGIMFILNLASNFALYVMSTLRAEALISNTQCDDNTDDGGYILAFSHIEFGYHVDGKVERVEFELPSKFVSSNSSYREYSSEVDLGEDRYDFQQVRVETKFELENTFENVSYTVVDYSTLGSSRYHKLFNKSCVDENYQIVPNFSCTPAKVKLNFNPAWKSREGPVFNNSLAEIVYLYGSDSLLLVDEGSVEDRQSFMLEEWQNCSTLPGKITLGVFNVQFYEFTSQGVPEWTIRWFVMGISFALGILLFLILPSCLSLVKSADEYQVVVFEIAAFIISLVLLDIPNYMLLSYSKIDSVEEIISLVFSIVEDVYTVISGIALAQMTVMHE